MGANINNSIDYTKQSRLMSKRGIHDHVDSSTKTKEVYTYRQTYLYCKNPIRKIGSHEFSTRHQNTIIIKSSIKAPMCYKTKTRIKTRVGVGRTYGHSEKKVGTLNSE